MKLFKILTTVILANLASAASAQSTAPLTFGDSDTDEDNWNYLMHFKLWGTEGISFGNRPEIYDSRLYDREKNGNDYSGYANVDPDTLGWVGTASGDLKTGEGGWIDGPIIVGGSVTGSKISLVTGPVRTSTGSISCNHKGTTCTGKNTSGACENVPEIRSDLNVPELKGVSLSGTFNVSGRTVLDVNSRCPGNDICDIYLNSINFANDSRLVVQMPEGGRPTRIFVNKLYFGTHPEIVVSYGKGDLKQTEYQGNLLLYVNSDITFTNIDNVSIMGSIVSTGTIKLICNIVFAGQLIANKIEIGNEIRAENFVFKKFEPNSGHSVLGNKTTYFDEDDTWQTIDLGLNNAAEENISFDYCFEFYSATGVQNTYAGYQDVSASDTSHKFPICNKSESAKATIKVGDTKAEGIYIKPLVDGYVEKDESLWLQINNLEGAKLASNYEDGKGYKIYIVSNDKLPTVSSELVVSVNEDSKHTFTSSEFKFQHASQKFASVIITSIPAKGSLTLNGTAVKANTTIAVKNLGKLTYAPAANDFGNSYTTFKYKVVDDGTGDNTSAEYTATVNVIPVNDKPSVSDVVFTVGELDHAVSGGPIEVKDVANERSKDTYTYSLDTSNDDYKAFNSTFEIVTISDYNATIKVKSGASLDYSKKKQYVAYAYVTDNAKTETTKVNGPMTSAKFKITVNVTKSSLPESSSSEKNETVIVKLDPLHFEIDSVAVTDEDENQSLWNRLMKYKLWGTDSIVFNKHGFRISETNGYTGTAKGNVIFNNGNHTLGGPIISGGNLQISYPNMSTDNDSLLKGPVRAEWLILPQWYKAVNVRYEGVYCFEKQVYFDFPDRTTNPSGYASDLVNDFIANIHKTGGKIYADWDQDMDEIPGLPDLNLDGPYSDCPKNVPMPDRDLSVPVFDETGITWEPAVELTSGYLDEGIGYIHVPPITKEDINNEHTWFDKYVENIEMGGSRGKILYILMPSNIHNANGKSGRLTRIFSRDGINIEASANDAKIQVVYVNEDATWNGSSWEGVDTETMTIVSNVNYAGNLMFITNADIAWRPMNANEAATFQGTYITTGDFNIGDHINVAGQLIAGKKLKFESDFNGDFHYVTFNKSEVSSSQSSSSSSATSSSAVKSSSSSVPSSSWSEAIGSSNSSTLRSSSSTVVKSSSSSKTIAAKSSSSRNDKASSSSYNNAKSSSSSAPSSSWSEAIGSSNSSTLRSSSSTIAKSSSSSKGIAANSSSSRNDKASSSSYNNAKSSSSTIAKSSSSSKTIAANSSSSRNDNVSSSSSRNDKASSSSYNDKKSSSSSKISSDDSDIPDFYVRMTGAFEFEIVMDESVPSLAKKYAVMDMKGQVLTVGELNDKNAYVKVPTRGAYIVKVGLGYRRINVR